VLGPILHKSDCIAKKCLLSEITQKSQTSGVRNGFADDLVNERSQVRIDERTCYEELLENISNIEQGMSA
jgi:hypothetical protein